MFVKPVNRIHITGQIDKKVEYLLNQAKESIQQEAKSCKTHVKIAQKGNRILVNSGAITSHFDYTKLEREREFFDRVAYNLYANKTAKKEGLREALIRWII